MSSRQLRKLQQQRELEQAKIQAEAEEEEESEEEPIARPPKPKASLFANLAALDDEDQADTDKDEAGSTKDDVSEPENPTPAPAPKPKKPKKKKKKAKGKSKEATADKQKSEDEIEEALRELDLKKPSGGATGQDTRPAFDPEYERVCALLGIQTQHLKVANEMRNLFGKTAIENHDDAGGPVGRGARRRQRGQQQQVDLETALKGHHPPGKGLSELILRRNCFVQGKDEWPKGTTGGLTMAVVDDMRETDGTVEFRYVHDKTYQSVQQAFHGYVELGDPQNLIGLLTRNPYHISLLTQVSKIAKDQSDHALSADLLERALFTFGRAATTLFSTKLAEGKARLDFHRPENRELWLVGYQYTRSLIMKGTYRTAFEWAKLLLSLDPEGDPYCMRLMMHHLALRAHQFDWLLDISDPKDRTEGCLGPMVRMSNSDVYVYHTLPSLGFAALQMRDGTKSRELLTKAMEQLPWLFARLFQDLNLDVPKSIWGTTPRSGAEELFTTLYIHQTKDLWNTPEATALLMEIAHTISKVDAPSIPPVKDSVLTLDVVRFLYLDNTPALMALAPSALLHRSNNSDADPLPPDDNVISYESQRIPLQQHSDDDSDGGDGLRGHADPLAALRGFMPPLVLPRFGLNGDGGDDSDGSDGEVFYRDIADPARDARGREEGDAERPSVTRRLLNLLWQTAGQAGREEETEAESDGRVDNP